MLEVMRMHACPVSEAVLATWCTDGLQVSQVPAWKLPGALKLLLPHPIRQHLQQVGPLLT